MINKNVYDDGVPLYIPSRDPREVNAVARLKALQSKEYCKVEDEDVQVADLNKILSSREETSVDNSTAPASEPIIVEAATHFEFPTVGDSSKLYVATAENNNEGFLYRWCSEENCYKKPYSSLDNITLDSVSVINGGDANS